MQSHQGGTPRGGLKGSTLEFRLISDKEWLYIRDLRGANLTGFPSHVNDAGKTYHWPWGQQPDKDTQKLIARRCPVKAAKAFLKVFLPRDPKVHNSGWMHPKIQPKAGL